MLSYRHGFHAGNFADLLKHLVLVQIIDYLKAKPAPIRYIDTHAGAGRYDIGSEMSLKTGEFQAGVGALVQTSLPAVAAGYYALLGPFLERNQYPGSPLIAATLLRDQDELRLYERHPTDFASLAALFKSDERVRVFNSDGFDALKSQLPVQRARALVLMDSAYELEADYRQVPEAIQEGLRRMPHAIFVIWYPVVAPRFLQPMLKRLARLGGNSYLRMELRLKRNADSKGMTATGMCIINPPWTLARELEEPLRAIAQQLGGEVVMPGLEG